LHRLSRGRTIGDFGLKGGDPLGNAARGDCDEGDAKLGLCGVHVPSPAKEELDAAEQKVEKQLSEHEVRARLGVRVSGSGKRELRRSSILPRRSTARLGGAHQAVCFSG
jgi:hypothetical protein